MLVTGKRVQHYLQRNINHFLERMRFRRASVRSTAGKTVRVVFIGAGRIAWEHLKTLAAMKGVEVVGICNRGRGDLRPISRAFRVPRTSTDWLSLVEELKPDAAFVLVDPFSTYEVAEILLRRGIHCLIEKPPGVSIEEAEAMAEVAEQSGCINMVGLNRRYYSSIRGALDLVQRHSKLVAFHMEHPERIHLLVTQDPGRYQERHLQRWLFIDGIHHIDLMRRIGGDVVEVRGSRKAFSGGVGESFSLALTFKNGITGTYASHWRSPAVERLVLFGEGVQVVLEPYSQGRVLYPNGIVHPLPVAQEDVLFKPGFYQQNLAFLRAVATGGAVQQPGVNLHEALQSMRLVETINSI